MKHLDEESRNNIFLIDGTANPAPLGLCAFGLTTIALSLHNAGVTALGSPVLAMAIFYGGIAQVIAGAMEWKKNNTFGLLTFGSFGFFWISFATLLLLPALNVTKAPGPVELAAFLGIWGLFSFGLFICSIRMHRMLMITLLMLVIVFVVLMLAQLTGNPLILFTGGITGLITGGLALFIGLGQAINEVYGSKVL
ncbi:MAG: acetate uptake transporter, partial [Methanoregulaceae archaeon]|nr:acetate uptake transporter [Methanoregulaceae archaeon]